VKKVTYMCLLLSVMQNVIYICTVSKSRAMVSKEASVVLYDAEGTTQLFVIDPNGRLEINTCCKNS